MCQELFSPHHSVTFPNQIYFLIQSFPRPSETVVLKKPKKDEVRYNLKDN